MAADEDLPCRFVCGRSAASTSFTGQGYPHSLLSKAIPAVRRTRVPHPAMSPNNVAVITGGASGIGLAAAMRFARLGMNVCIADIDSDHLREAGSKLSSVSHAGAANILVKAVDVSRLEDVTELEHAVRERF